MVIGVNSTVELPPSTAHFEQKEAPPSAPWHEPDAKNTPAEPIASVRVRELAGRREAESQRPSNVCDDRVVTATELRPAAQYVPPMRPPESIPGHVASQPKVQIVPDCDTRVRTARSLRRQSSVPPAMGMALGFGQGWPLYIAVAIATCATVIGVVRNFTSNTPAPIRHATSVASNPSAATVTGVGSSASTSPATSQAVLTRQDAAANPLEGTGLTSLEGTADYNPHNSDRPTPASTSARKPPNITNSAHPSTSTAVLTSTKHLVFE